MSRRRALRADGARASDTHFIYRDAPNPIAWSRPTTRRDCPAGATPPTDTLFFVYASMPDTPDLAYVDTCSNGSIDEAWRYLTDERGSVRFVVNANDGTVIQEISYDAWGAPTFGVTSETTQPFGYIGGIYDAETGFWHLGARDYDPTIGRWTTKDPIGFDGGYNLYGYATSEPVNRGDVTGFDVRGFGPWMGGGMGLGGTVGCGIYYADGAGGGPAGWGFYSTWSITAGVSSGAGGGPSTIWTPGDVHDFEGGGVLTGGGGGAALGMGGNVEYTRTPGSEPVWVVAMQIGTEVDAHVVLGSNTTVTPPAATALDSLYNYFRDMFW